MCIIYSRHNYITCYYIYTCNNIAVYIVHSTHNYVIDSLFQSSEHNCITCSFAYLCSFWFHANTLLYKTYDMIHNILPCHL